MKKYLIPLLGALLFGGVSAAAQDDHVKTGWSCIPVPDVSYSTDIGWNFGAFGDLFYYGDGSTYPNFIHHIALAGARSTRGAWYLHGMFDSKTLIPGRRFAASLTYRDCTMNNFYGFNGLNTPYFPELDLNAETHQAYYTDHRKVIRSAATIWSPLGNTGHLDWIGGLVFRRIRISDFTHDNYNSDNTLFGMFLFGGAAIYLVLTIIYMVLGYKKVKDWKVWMFLVSILVCVVCGCLGAAGAIYGSEWIHKLFIA